MSKAPINPFTLDFKSFELKSQYDAYYLPSANKSVRIAMGLAIFLYGLFSATEFALLDYVPNELIIIRALSCLIYVCVIIYTYQNKTQRHFQFVMSAVVLIGSFGIIRMIQISEFIGLSDYYVGLILAIMYTHGLLRLRFIYATFVSWISLLAYVFVALTSLNVTTPELANHLLFLVSANILGMFASYHIEHSMRTEFWQQEELAAQSRELEKAHKRKTEELNSAREVQRALLPQSQGLIESLDLSYSITSASEIGGDFYDHVLDENGVLTIGMGDATGHGAKAGVLVSIIKTLFTDLAPRLDLPEFVDKASLSIRRLGLKKIFMAFGIVRIIENRIQFVGAGLPDALVFRADFKSIEHIPLKGLPLGFPVANEHLMSTISLRDQDIVMMMTDGLVELLNPERAMLGVPFVEEFLIKHAHLTSKEISTKLELEIKNWLKGEDQNDDITFCIIKKVQNVNTISKPLSINNLTANPELLNLN